MATQVGIQANKLSLLRSLECKLQDRQEADMDQEYYKVKTMVVLLEHPTNETVEKWVYNNQIEEFVQEILK
jgi:hypothetical protein